LVILLAAIELSFQCGFEIAAPQSVQHGIARGHVGISDLQMFLRYQYSAAALCLEATFFAKYTTAICAGAGIA
jgi:hypothetical protein